MNQLDAYCEAHTSPVSKLLYDLERETHLKTLAPQMLSGPLQGQLLRFLSLLAQPQYILEIGTFTGYAAICLAAGLKEGGKLHTIEVNQELEYLIRKYVDRAGYNDKIQLHIGNARAVIPTLEMPFDLVFIDAGKQDYAFYYELVLNKVAPGGLIIADNVLWGGKIIAGDTDPDTEALRAFNIMVQGDSRVENMLLPIRDGLMVARKL